MLSYESISGKRSQFLSLTCMEEEVFDELHTAYARHWKKYITEFTIAGEKGNRAHRERKDGVLKKTEDQLFFMLHYLKSNSIQEHHAASYDMQQSQCNQWLHLLLRLLHLTIKDLGELPERDSSKLKKAIQGIQKVFIDGTQRYIDRPLDKAASQMSRNYSSNKRAESKERHHQR